MVTIVNSNRDAAYYEELRLELNLIEFVYFDSTREEIEYAKTIVIDRGDYDSERFATQFDWLLSDKGEPHA